MSLDVAECERARVARDPSYDGRFFTGVRTAGVYCRPVCPRVAARLRLGVLVVSNGSRPIPAAWDVEREHGFSSEVAGAAKSLGRELVSVNASDPAEFHNR